MRVLAIRDTSAGKILNIYGEGEMIGDKVPDIEPFKGMNLDNPCIKLDSGEYIYMGISMLVGTHR